MSLNKPQLVEDLDNLFEGTINSNTNEAEAKEAFIQGLATIIDGYIKTAKITYTGGLTAVNGAVGGQFNHTVS